jgi:sec-independent protein translocase protein TatC
MSEPQGVQPEEGGAPMALKEHLRELRVRLRKAAIALFVATAATFYFWRELYDILNLPTARALKEAGFKEITMVYLGPTEAFWVQFKVSLYVGIFLASPFIFHQIWQFIAPGLYRRERRVAVPFAIFSGLFFIGGAVFCYFFVLPAAFRFFMSYSAEMSEISSRLTDIQVHLQALPSMEPYFDLTTKMLLAFGLIFEMPLLIFFLSLIGLVTHRKLWKFNRYAVVISFIIGAILTPGPDIVSQLLMAGPLIVLYNLSILVAFFVTRRRERAAASDPVDPSIDAPLDPEDKLE